MWGEEGIFKSFEVFFGHFLKNIKAYFNVQIKSTSILTSDVEHTEALDHSQSLPLSNSQDLHFQNVCKCREHKDPGSDLPCLMEERGPNRLRLFEVKESAQEHRVCEIKEMMELDGKLRFFYFKVLKV